MHEITAHRSRDMNEPAAALDDLLLPSRGVPDGTLSPDMVARLGIPPGTSGPKTLNGAILPGSRHGSRVLFDQDRLFQSSLEGG